jgi:hypothetical protein
MGNDFYNAVVDIEFFDELQENRFKIFRFKVEGIRKYNELFIRTETSECNGKNIIFGKLTNKKEFKNKKKETKRTIILYPQMESQNLFICIDGQGINNLLRRG